MTLYSA